MSKVTQQIGALENKRAASVARREEIQMGAINEGRSKSDTEKQEFDNLSADITTIDAELVDLRLMERQIVASATAVPATAGASPQAASAARAGAPTGIISVGANLEKGQRFGRYAMAMFQAEGNPAVALSIVRGNKRWMDTSPELEKVLMAAVATGDTTTAGWASELVYAQNLANEFIDYLRPLTIIGRLPRLRRVPFNIRMGSQTAGSTGNWVGQAKPIPVSKLTTSSLSLGITKAAGIVTVDDELMRSSSPSAELLVRDDLAKSVQSLIDLSFIDPNQFGLANIQPASVLSGVTPITPSGTNAAAFAVDIAALFAAAIAANLDPTTGVFVMSPTTALNLSLMLTANGVPQYPNITINGGTLLGLPVVVSNQAKIAGSPQFGEMIVLLLQEEILLADDGQVVVEISKEAALELKDNPTNSGAGGEVATSMVSMFQTHSAAIKAVRYINWAKRRTAAAAFIQAAAYKQS
jgi:HK97 family phage major capsid protein